MPGSVFMTTKKTTNFRIIKQIKDKKGRSESMGVMLKSQQMMSSAPILLQYINQITDIHLQLYIAFFKERKITPKDWNKYQSISDVINTQRWQKFAKALNALVSIKYEHSIVLWP